MRPPTWLVVTNLVLALLFVVSAGLQYNDPDPIRWATMYLAAAAASLLALHTRRGWMLAAAVALVALVWGADLWEHVVGFVQASDLWRKMSEKGGKVEEMREAGGLTIMLAWLSVVAVVGYRRAQKLAR